MLGQTRDEETVESEIREIKQVEQMETGGLRELLAPWLRPTLIVGMGLAIFQQFVGINTIIYYAPTTLTSVGFGDSAAIVSSAGIGALNVLLTIVAILLVDRVGRKPLLLFGAVGMSASLAVLAIASLVLPEPTGIGPVGIITPHLPRSLSRIILRYLGPCPLGSAR